MVIYVCNILHVTGVWRHYSFAGIIADVVA